MQNVRAVYTSKRVMTGRKFAELAEGHGVEIRFLGLGGFVPSDRETLSGQALTKAAGGALLVVGAREPELSVLAELDILIERRDKAAVAALLNAHRLPWCELYTRSFQYKREVTARPKDKAKIDGSIPKTRLGDLKKAKIRYIFSNPSRKKGGGDFMNLLAAALVEACEGVLADYQRPSR